MSLRPTALAVALLAATGAAQAQQAPTVEQLAERLRVLEQRLGVPADTAPGEADGLAALDQRLKAIERRLELQAADAPKAASTSTLSVSASKGVSLKSPADEGVELKFRGLIQADGRSWIDDEALPQNDGFLVRRIQPVLEGSYGKLLGFRLMPELAGDSASIADAYIDLKFDPRATLRVGKFKAPIGLERLQPSGGTTFIELGLPSELAPGRDLGVQLQGEVDGGALAYAVGAFNGAPDGRDGASANADDRIEYAARVFWEPFRGTDGAASGLGIGLAASTGDAEGLGNAALPRYRTPGQVQFFGYRGAVLADGERRRLAPQAYWYHGPVGLLGEYIESSQQLRAGTTAARIDNRAWQLAASWVLTGEDASYRGVVKPDRPFTGDGFGAFELAARVGALNIDEDAFPLFADPATAARRARAWTVGLNWYLTQNLKLVTNYSEAAFDGGAAAGADRETEKTLFTRAQVAF
ncbi:MAG TPA: porin [Lysobacter sp.]|nr:porin [Lysobacter sp.]